MIKDEYYFQRRALVNAQSDVVDELQKFMSERISELNTEAEQIPMNSGENGKPSVEELKKRVELMAKVNCYMEIQKRLYQDNIKAIKEFNKLSNTYEYQKNKEK